MSSNSMMAQFQLSLLVAFLIGLNGCTSLSVSHQEEWKWDHFVYAQQWPMTSCIYANNITHTHKCRIPANVSTWTVHGLWPSYETSEGPVSCNVSNPEVNFKPEALAPILAQLAKFWPNLYSDSDFYNFWKHEWCKHGTCALSDEDVNSELKYFGKGLELRQAFDLLGMLRNAGIKPADDNTYEYVEFMKALRDGLGAEPKVSCVHDKETKTQYVYEVEFCLSKKFEVIECPKKHSETEDTPAEFVELNRQRSRNAYVAMVQKRKSRSPESCESSFASRNSGGDPTCKYNEPIAYPIIKPF